VNRILIPQKREAACNSCEISFKSVIPSISCCAILAWLIAASTALAQDETRHAENAAFINGTGAIANPFPAPAGTDSTETRGGTGFGDGRIITRLHVQGDAPPYAPADQRIDLGQPFTLAGRAASPNLNIYLSAAALGNIVQNAGAPRRPISARGCSWRDRWASLRPFPAWTSA
jgi:hypothetical protein